MTDSLETPPGFALATGLAKAATDGGFRLGGTPVPGHAAWLAFTSTTVPGPLYLAGSTDRGPFHLALSRPSVARALQLALDLPQAAMPAPGNALTVSDLSILHTAIDRAWSLSRALPDNPLAEFEAATVALPRTTEAERVRIERIGQDIFRDRLLRDWHGRCPLTGITDSPLLRASHIIPWKTCEADADRLDPANGLLLSALWDAAFDVGLVSFTDEGAPLYSPGLTAAARQALTTTATLFLTPGHRPRLDWHRRELFGKLQPA